jgi:hypothetical protein
MPDITRKTFEKMDTDSKLNVLFDYAVCAKDASEESKKEIEALNIKAIRWGALGGMFSAIGAFLSYLLIWHISK